MRTFTLGMVLGIGAAGCSALDEAEGSADESTAEARADETAADETPVGYGPYCADAFDAPILAPAPVTFDWSMRETVPALVSLYAFAGDPESIARQLCAQSLDSEDVSAIWQTSPRESGRSAYVQDLSPVRGANLVILLADSTSESAETAIWTLVGAEDGLTEFDLEGP